MPDNGLAPVWRSVEDYVRMDCPAESFGARDGRLVYVAAGMIFPS